MLRERRAVCQSVKNARAFSISTPTKWKRETSWSAMNEALSSKPSPPNHSNSPNCTTRKRNENCVSKQHTMDTLLIAAAIHMRDKVSARFCADPGTSGAGGAGHGAEFQRPATGKRGGLPAG